MDNAIAFDETAGTFGSLVLECVLTVSFMNFVGDVGVVGGLSVGIDDDEDFLRKRCMMDEVKIGCRRHPSQPASCP